MKIDLSHEADKNTFTAWLTIALASQDGMFEKCFGSHSNPDRERFINAEIKLTINGVEFDARPTLERLYETFQEECTKVGRRWAENVLGDAVTLKLDQHWQERDRDDEF